MVIEDLFQPKNTDLVSGISDSREMAHPLDRLAAFVLDVFIVLPPFVLLFLAPLKRLALIAVVESDQSALVVAVSLMVVLGLTLFIAYQALSVRYWGATVGQRFFGLRVRSIWGTELPLTVTLIRSFGLLATILLGGLPALSLFSDSRRRALHDRISDTWVASLNKRSRVLAPGLRERALVQGVLSGLFALVVLVFTATLHRVYNNAASLDQFDENLCEDVSVAIDELRSQASQSRMETALSLYGANRVDRDCLKQEAYNAIYVRAMHTDLAFLALALVYDRDEEVAQEYLRKACEVSDLKSDICTLSRAIESISKPEELQPLIRRLGRSDRLYAKIWALRFEMSQQNYDHALKLLDRIDQTEMLAPFIVKMRIQALYFKGEAQSAEIASQIAIEAQAKEDAGELAHFMCFEGLEKDCSAAKSYSCRWLDRLSNQHAGLSQGQLLTRFRIEQCRDPQEGLALLAEASQKEIVEFRRGLELLEQSQNREGMRLLNRLMQRTSSSTLHREIARQWIKSARTSSDLDSLKDYILNMTTSREQQIMAQNMLVAFQKFDDPIASVEMVRLLQGRQGGLNSQHRAIADWAERRLRTGRRPASVKHAGPVAED